MASDLFTSFSLYAVFPTIVDSAYYASNDGSPDGDQTGTRNAKTPIVPILESVGDNNALPTNQPIG